MYVSMYCNMYMVWQDWPVVWKAVQLYNEIVWWFVLLYNGGLLCCIAEGLEVVDIFAQPLANPTHIS